MAVRWESLSKTYPGGVSALQNVTAAVEQGEFAVLVGASGSGKTTLLRLIAGLEQPTTGRIWLDERDVATTPAHQRRVAMVFQRPMLYPHLTVRENLLWGATGGNKRSGWGRWIAASRSAPQAGPKQVSALATGREPLGAAHHGAAPQEQSESAPPGHAGRLSSAQAVSALTGKAEWARRCDELAERMSIRGLLERRADTLSGGECQRVAVARAFLRQPSVVLLDEPFTYLDVVQRQALRHWLQDIHREMGGTMLMVTHDPDEAWMLGAQLMVLSHGRCLQVGARAEVALRPASREVLEVLSAGGVNWLTGQLRSAEGHWRLEIHGNAREAREAQEIGNALEIGGSAAAAAEQAAERLTRRRRAPRSAAVEGPASGAPLGPAESSAAAERVVAAVPPDGLTIRPTSERSANRAQVMRVDWLSDRQVVHLRWSENGTVTAGGWVQDFGRGESGGAFPGDSSNELHVTVSHRAAVQPGSTVEVQLSSDRLYFFDADTGKNLLLNER